jgi:hypothetical protein
MSAKKGDRYLRRLFVVGAQAVLGIGSGTKWAASLLTRNALVNKMARMVEQPAHRAEAYG